MTPDDPPSRDSIALALQYAKQYEESLASWKRKLELAPDDDRAIHWIDTVECEIAAKARKGGA